MTGFTSKSPCPPLPTIKEETAPEFLLERANYFSRQGLEAFLEDGLSGKQLHYKDFESLTCKIASSFYKRGLRKGDIVIYTTSYQIHQIPLMVGVWRANGILRSIYVDESSETLLEKVEESNVRFIFCDAETAQKCSAVAEKCKWDVAVIVCGPEAEGFENIEQFYKDDGSCCPKLEIKGDDPALILPTSGTTGPSKGALYLHKTIICHLRLLSNVFYKHKISLIASKGTHISGTEVPCVILISGKFGVVLPKVSKEILIRSVDKYKPGLVFAFPSFVLALGTSEAEGFDVTSVETIFTGGSPITKEIHKAFMALPSVNTVLIVFGMTEGPSVATNQDTRDNRQHDSYLDLPESSVGRPYPETEIQIRDAETMKVLGPNEKGEVFVKGEFLFKEYYKNPEGTKAAFVDGWFRTGDVGILDENGFLTIVDRQKDIFKYFHNHISPTELECVIASHPEVKEVCVFPIPDEFGHVPRAFVTLKNPDGTKALTDLAKEVKIFADDKLATYKNLRGGLYIVEDLPKGKSGKVDRMMVSKLQLPIY